MLIARGCVPVEGGIRPSGGTPSVPVGEVLGLFLRNKINGGPFWTVPELLFESKKLIPGLQQLLIDRAYILYVHRGSGVPGSQPPDHMQAHG